MIPDADRSRDSSPCARQDSEEKSPESKETSPKTNSKRLSQHRDSLDSQTDQKKSDTDIIQREKEVPPASSEPLSQASGHSKTGSTDSKHSDGVGHAHAHEQSPNSDTDFPIPQSVISPTLVMATMPTDEGEGDSRQINDQSLGENLFFEMLDKKNFDDLSDRSLDTSHDTSDDQQDLTHYSVEGKSHDTSGDHHEHILSPIAEGASVRSSSERQSPSRDLLQDMSLDATLTEPHTAEGEDDNDGLEILAQLDEVLDREDQESSAGEDDDDKGSKFRGGGSVEEPEVSESGVEIAVSEGGGSEDTDLGQEVGSHDLSDEPVNK